jgi:hypothetical protein
MLQSLIQQSQLQLQKKVDKAWSAKIVGDEFGSSRVIDI